MSKVEKDAKEPAKEIKVVAKEDAPEVPKFKTLVYDPI